jgi:Putative adhesin
VNKQRFDTPGPVLVRVDNRAGPVRLRTHTGATTEVEVVADDGDDDVAEQVLVEHQEVDGRHRVLVEVPHPAATGNKGVRIYGRQRVRVVVPGLGDLLRSSLLGGHEVTVSVLVPEGAGIEVVTESGEVTGEGRFGAANVETRSGDLSLDSVADDLNMRSGSGDVTVRSVAGEARVTTASGDVSCGTLGGASHIKTASGDVGVESSHGFLSVQTASGDVNVGQVVSGCELQSASGDQTIERMVTGRARLQTASGDLSVAIARSTLVAVDAETVSGDLYSEIDLDLDEPSGAAPGPPEQRVDLRARTVSGDVRIQRAPT